MRRFQGLEVPVIAVFTKYDQFLRNVAIDLEDRHYEDRSINVSQKAKAREAKKLFDEHFMGPLGEGILWVQLRGGFRIKYQATF